MSKTREKRAVIQGVTREQSEEAFGKYAAADAKVQQITAKMDGEITKIRDKYQEDLSKLTEARKLSGDMLEAYATENKDELFAKKKSMEMTHGKIGFRTGTPKLKTLKGFTWPAVTNILKEILPDYVRTVDEPAKDKLLADRDLDEVAERLSKCGIMVDQDETFFIEPKKETEEVA